MDQVPLPEAGFFGAIAAFLTFAFKALIDRRSVAEKRLDERTEQLIDDIRAEAEKQTKARDETIAVLQRRVAELEAQVKGLQDTLDAR